MAAGSWRVDAITVSALPTGSIRIGAEPAAPAGLELVPLDGGYLEIDPAAPDQPPSAVISDPTRAGPTLEVLYGSDVADAVRRAGDDPLSVRLADSPELRGLQRLGTVWWLARRSPLPLDPALLAFEEAVLQARYAALLDPDTEWTEPIEAWAPALTGLGRRLSSDPGAALPPEPFPQLLAEALQTLISLLDDEQAALIEAQLADLGEATATVSAEPERPELAEWPELREWQDTLTPQRGSPGRRGALSVSGVGTVDWRRLPRGVTSSAEGSLSWLLDPSGGLSVMVAGPATVRAHPSLSEAPNGRPEPERLQFRLYQRGWPLPLAVGSLTPHDGGSWIGGLALDAETRELVTDESPVELYVDVGLPDRPRPPNTVTAEAAAEADRWSVRALSSYRLARACTGPVSAQLTDSAAAALTRARNLWADQAGRTPLPDGRPAQPAAARRAARCAAWLGALQRAGLITAPRASAVGDGVEVDEPERRNGHRPAADAPGRDARADADADTRPPALDDPGLDLTLAERWLLIGSHPGSRR